MKQSHQVTKSPGHKRHYEISSFCLLSAVFMLFFIFVSNCYATTWTSNELIEKAKELDGKKISYKGELVTTMLSRGEYSWINLNDGSNAIGVWCKSTMLNDIKFAGNYKYTGDMLEATGLFHRACPEHNGELDIHAETIKVLKHGCLNKERINPLIIRSSIMLFIITLLTVFIFRKKL